MKSPLSERKKKNQKVHRGRRTLFRKANKLGSNGASVYVVVEYNRKVYEYEYNNRPGEEWPPSKAMLVSERIGIFSNPAKHSG
jgi:hypothetical protein